MTVCPVSSSRLDAEGRVLLGQREQGLGQLVLVGLGLGLHGHVDHGLGEGERLEDDLVVGVAQGVAGGGLLEADGGHDVAGEHGVEVLAGVGVHLEDAADPLLAVLGRVDHARALGQGARVDPQVGELADVGVGHDLEGQGRERGRVVGRALDLDALLAGDGAHGRRDVERARQVVDDGVEHGLDALVLEGGAAQDRHGVVAEGHRAQGAGEVLGEDLLVAQVLLHDDVVVVGDHVDELGVGGLGRRPAGCPGSAPRSSPRPCRRPTPGPACGPGRRRRGSRPRRRWAAAPRRWCSPGGP